MKNPFNLLRSSSKVIISTAAMQTTDEPVASFSIEPTLNPIKEILQTEGFAWTPDLPTNIGNLVGIYQGYKNAYQILNEEVGNFRQTTAPIVRNKGSRSSPPKIVEFLGRIGLWFDQSETKINTESPSIFLVTLPKSGTVYISHTLAQTLNYDHTSTLVTPTFPKNIVWGPMLMDFLGGELVSASHMQPDETNLAMLQRCGVNKIVLHIRDPRAALLSWAHFVLKSMRKNRNLHHPQFRTLKVEDNLDYFVEFSFPIFVAWINDWIKAISEKPELNVLIMSHEELVENRKAYFDKIFAFYNLKPKQLTTVDKTETTHFRSGDNDEWRNVFPPELIVKMNVQIPNHLCDRFGWIK